MILMLLVIMAGSHKKSPQSAKEWCFAMRVLFVYPFFLQQSALEREWMMPYFPLGLLYLAAAARQAGHEVAVFDGTFAPGPQIYEQQVQAFQPDVVCLASLITLRPMALELAQISRARGCRVIFGGPDPSQSPEAYLTRADEGRAILGGEAENSLVAYLAALAEGSDWRQVPGLIWQGPEAM
jgi:anaerobic magnesium-protoporphyrin IX monomethyl ester cyclase